MGHEITFGELIVEINDRLSDHLISHGFGGALALAFYTLNPRATRNIDLNVALPTDRAREIFSVLPESISWNQSDVSTCLRDGQVRLWSNLKGIGIPSDLFFPQHGFHEAVINGIVHKPFGEPGYFLPIISATHLVVFKALYNRLKDWVDIGSMLEADVVDLAEAIFWLKTLVGMNHPSCQRMLETIAAIGNPASKQIKSGKGDIAIDWKSFN